MLRVNYYYNLLVDGESEDGLLSICRSCARERAADVQWASRGDEESECGFCDAANDPQRKVELDALVAQYTRAR